MKTSLGFRRTVILAGIAGAILLSVVVVQAKGPAVTNQNTPTSHPNLLEANRMAASAYGSMMAAKANNEFDAAGHAQNAMNYLTQAKSELRAIPMSAVGSQAAVSNAPSSAHKNLGMAQILTNAMYSSLVAAKANNEFDAAGHAQNAMNYAAQVVAEMDASALYINTNQNSGPPHPKLTPVPTTRKPTPLPK
jgi:hypothetical protein